MFANIWKLFKRGRYLPILKEQKWKRVDADNFFNNMQLPQNFLPMIQSHMSRVWWAAFFFTCDDLAKRSSTFSSVTIQSFAAQKEATFCMYFARHEIFNNYLYSSRRVNLDYPPSFTGFQMYVVTASEAPLRVMDWEQNILTRYSFSNHKL